MNPFRTLLMQRAARTPVGTWIMSCSPLVAEAMGHAGFDWAVVDMEHAPLDLMAVVHQLQAVAASKMAPVVRVPWNDTVMVKRVLDAGAASLLFPFVQSAAEARAAVAATRYPPEGVRGMAGMSRASRYGTVPDFYAAANKSVAVVVQLETAQALAALEEIAAVPGVDALFVGPADLSGSIGLAGQMAHPQVLALMADAARRARAVGKPIGSVGGTPEVAKQYLAMGYDYVAIASDMGLLMRGAQAVVQAMRPVDAAASSAAGGAPSGY